MLLPLTFGKLNKLAIAPVNEMRTAAGLDPADSMVEVLTRPPLTLYSTAEPFEYPRSDWPDTYEMVGPASWNPPAEAPEWLEEIDRPIVMVTCSTEKQDDRKLLQAVLDGLADTEFFVVGTSAAHDPESFDTPANARVERFVAHDPIVKRSTVVVCHGGMGITQRALLNAVPPVIVPFGRISMRWLGAWSMPGQGSVSAQRS